MRYLVVHLPFAWSVVVVLFNFFGTSTLVLPEEQLQQTGEGDAAQNTDDGRQSEHQSDHHSGKVNSTYGV